MRSMYVCPCVCFKMNPMAVTDDLMNAEKVYISFVENPPWPGAQFPEE